MFPGTAEAKETKTIQLAQVLQEEAQSVRAGAGLPPDYQTVPMFNLRNVASEPDFPFGLKKTSEEP